MAPKAIVREFIATKDAEGMREFIHTKSVEVDRGLVSPCWDWTGVKAKSLFPKISYKTEEGVVKNISVRTIIVQVIHNQEVIGRKITAICGTESCVNPGHIEYTASFSLVLQSKIEAADKDALVEYLRSVCKDVQSSKWDGDPCWESEQAYINSRGYIVIQKSGARTSKNILAHRYIAEFFHGEEIGSTPVHHKCANRACLNPGHYQITSHCQNTAEMLARNYYENRISEAESIMVQLLKTLPEGVERDRIEAFLSEAM